MKTANVVSRTLSHRHTHYVTVIIIDAAIMAGMYQGEGRLILCSPGSS